MLALPISPGERTECCQWQIKRGERVAAVYIFKVAPTTVENIGHRNRSVARQVLSAQMCLTSVFGMAALLRAASGRYSGA